MSPPMDLGSSSQDTVSSDDMKIQSSRVDPTKTVDNEHNGSQSSDGTSSVPDKKRKLRLVISDDEETPDDVDLQNSTDSDTDLPDI